MKGVAGGKGEKSLFRGIFLLTLPVARGLVLWQFISKVLESKQPNHLMVGIAAYMLH